VGGLYIEQNVLVRLLSQVYFQRVLSAKSPGRAEIMSYAAALGCIVLAIPPVLIGAIAKSAGKFTVKRVASVRRSLVEIQ